MHITLNHFVLLCVDVHKNVAFSNGEILAFWCENHELNAIFVSYDIKIESCIYAPVLLNLLNLGEINKMLGKASHHIFSPNSFNKFNNTEHSCKTLF